MQSEKYQQQDAMYHFPYHYLPGLDQRDGIRVHRQLSWALDYMTYMSFLADKVAEIKPTSLLDVGCGDARFIAMIKQSTCLLAPSHGPDASIRKCNSPAVTWPTCKENTRSCR